MNKDQRRSKNQTNFRFVLFTVFSIVGLTSFEAKGQVPELAWINHYNESPHPVSNATGITLDSQGSIIVSGRMNSNSINGSPTNDTDSYIAKYNGFGQLTWIRNLALPSYNVGIAVAADSLNNIYTTGFSGNPASSGYFSKYSTSGDLIWTKSVSSTLSLNAISTDALNNTYITGYYSGGNTYLAKNDPNGNVLWSKVINLNTIGSTPEHGTGVTVDTNGNVYLTGVYAKSGSQDVFVQKYDTTGNLLLTKTFLTDVAQSVDQTFDIKVDQTGNIFIAGTTYNASNGVAGNDAMLTKFDLQGNLLWTRLIGGGSTDFSNRYDEAWGLDIDANGTVYIAGHLRADSLFGGSFPAGLAKKADAFIAGYDTSGNMLWKKEIDSLDGDYAQDLVVGPNGNIYVSGHSLGMLTPTSDPNDFFGTHFVAMYTVPEPSTWICGISAVAICFTILRHRK